MMAAAALGCSVVASAFVARDVEVPAGAPGITLAGTLTLPDGETKLRGAVVLATGSGQQDRDETLMGHKPFKVIAETLSDAGYAVLRMDDRGVGGSGGDAASCTTGDFVGDILSGVSYVRTLYPDVPVGVLGHSEGGQIAVRAAVAEPKTAFIVTLGCPALKGDSLILSQMKALNLAMTGSETMFNRARPLQRDLLDIAMGPGLASVKQGAMAVRYGKDFPEQMAMPELREAVTKQLAAMTSPWYVAFLRYDPAADIAAVSVPWLALNGGRDLQVTPENLELIGKLNAGADTVLLERHNHLMQVCSSGLPDEYERISEDIDPEVVTKIVKWLDDVCK